MTVRLAGPDDALRVARLLTDFNTEFDTWVPELDVLERRFAALLATDDVVVIVSGEDPPTGFALVTLRPSPYYDGPVASLDELYVVPPCRGQGLGTEMVGLMLELLRGRSCGELQINVDEEDDGARRFYERHGFVNQEPGSSERMLCYLQEL